MPNRPLNVTELEHRLGEFVDPVLSIRRTVNSPAHEMASLSRAQQDIALHWVGVIAKTNPEMAYQFAQQAPSAFALMAADDIEAWVIAAMDTYDKLGMYPAIAVFKDVQTFADQARAKARGVHFDEVSGVLALFVRGLSGRALKLGAATDAYTDTDTLFVPMRLARLGTRNQNFTLYKAMVAHQWAQTRFGTFRADLHTALARFSDPDKARRLFHALETVRLDACIAREYAGLHRDLQALRAAAPCVYPASWQNHIARLQAPAARVDDTLDALGAVYDDTVPDALCYQGTLFPERAAQAIAARAAREKEQLQTALARLIAEKDRRTPPPERAPGTRVGVNPIPNPDRPGSFGFELQIDGEPIAPPDDVKSLMGSIVQDFGEIPNDYLIAVGDSVYRKDGPEKRPDDLPTRTDGEENAFIYNEWDYRRQHYRKDWCALREIEVPPVDEPFVAQTLRKYAGLAAGLRKTFEALRGEDRLQRRQKHGEDIDFDALIAALADMRRGHELGPNLFMKTHKLERNIAVMFMVDMSGSTKGWINEAEREALVLLCEALEVLGDRYAIYGFSGITRKRCELYRIKRFDEPYSNRVKQRIAGIKPQDYTRMGVAIRHLSALLKDIEARTKLLITLSDGKPDDYDGYRGDYGIEDTRQALIEARRDGIHPFCITIDTEARDYLPHMYGAGNYAFIDSVRKLPLRVSDIYRHLTR